jgi:peptide methionine sulfoxide reductase MsrB
MNLKKMHPISIHKRIPDSAVHAGIFFQPKLTINQPNDIYEKEADAMADKVMRMTGNENSHQPFFKPAVSSIQRKCAHCEEEEKKMQRKEKSNAGSGWQTFIKRVAQFL